MARDLRAEWLASPGTFGRLEPREFVRRDGKRTYWLFHCSCGQAIELPTDNVIAGRTTSCGCFRRELGREAVKRVAGINRLPEGEAVKRKLFRDYQRRAEQKARDFDLTYEEFSELIMQPCYICGAVQVNRCRGDRANGELRYNGLDRVDSRKGYTKRNVKPCCPTCNTAKMAMSHDEFVAWLERIGRFR